MPFNPRNLFEQSRQLLGTTQAELGKALGISRRTAQRWSSDGVPSYGLPNFARLLYPRHPDLASEIVAALGTSLEELGIVERAPPPAAPPTAAPPPPEALVDAVVCAAADAMERTPKEVRPGLHAAFTRAKELGLTVEVIERALAAARRREAPPAPEAATEPEPAASRAPKRRTGRG